MVKNAGELDSKFVAGTYKRFDVCLDKGSGCVVWDESGKEYLDCVAGIAVSNLGHAHPKVLSAIRKQSKKLLHCSNWFNSRPQAELAEVLAKIAPKGLSRTFFANSGTEAVEGALKLVRRKTGKKKVVAFEKAFHGRTMGALSLTWKQKYREPFEPLEPKVVRAKFNDISSVRSAVDADVGAVFVEPIQGEGGVNIPSDSFLRELRELCDEKGILLVCDEVQTGFGRCGAMFASELYNVVPDVMCLAKALGSGIPCGAVMAREDVFSALHSGEHGTTFGGNPLACAVALASIKVIKKEGLVENARVRGEQLVAGLRSIQSDAIVEARGKGLLVGLELKSSAWDYCVKMINAGLLVTCPTENVVRFTPPLTIGEQQINTAVEIARKILA
ncbi:aspartate aminotransferase family protein [Candidatus Micrarchaeota archaeon]|nr:aspartate aminotransferase family protein [Candidatus Micrarchaeota archaeon]